MTNHYRFTPEETDNIIRRFGEPFYAKAQVDIETYSARWTLNDFQLVPSYSANLVFMCRSGKYGDVVLKIGHKYLGELISEYYALREYNGRRFCKVLDADLDRGILLEERVKPGTPLRDEPSLERRLKVFSELHNGLHIEPADAGIYKTYSGWVERITDYMSAREDCSELYGHMKKARDICRAIAAEYSRKMLLHGDFHHDNILLGPGNNYVIIDPKGVVGDPVFDVARFILNEFDEDITPEVERKIIGIIDVLSESLHIPLDVVKKCFYVETAMGKCWQVEDGALPDDFPNLIRIVEFAESLMNA